ncbi:unnamed protein product [Musa acuminata subsp. malaccensis]|uniref:(wild Malaysian banana) hypothetical protein n=1 Tax=Musa acuminata subsp. malaccensis TaxID=214687 RepID=A0A804ICJ0_MUSAM|nr:unnamed protein product [Musa acuminata subsp. malaccensis]
MLVMKEINDQLGQVWHKCCRCEAGGSSLKPGKELIRWLLMPVCCHLVANQHQFEALKGPLAGSQNSMFCVLFAGDAARKYYSNYQMKTCPNSIGAQNLF